jgi:hypothetical protein
LQITARLLSVETYCPIGVTRLNEPARQTLLVHRKCGRPQLLRFGQRAGVSVISFDDAKDIASAPVGCHPQRVRNGKMLLVAIDH